VSHPVHVRIEYRERRSRLTTALRFPLVVPHLVACGVLGVAVAAAVAAAWCAVILTGRNPRALVRFVTGTLRYATRVGCYWMLVTDPFPAFRLRPGEQEEDDPVDVAIDEPERRSRLSALARLPLAIPALLIAYFLGLFALMMAFAAWWVILVTGRLPHSMFEVMELPHRYQARVSAYAWLLVDDYPWFQEEGGSAPAGRGIQPGVQPFP
jgi:uncharacterized protein DUF4389